MRVKTHWKQSEATLSHRTLTAVVQDNLRSLGGDISWMWSARAEMKMLRGRSNRRVAAETHSGTGSISRGVAVGMLFLWL